MHWVLIVLWLNAQNGDFVRADPPETVDVTVCLTPHADPQKDGLVAFRLCRQVDADGNPVPAAPIQPDQPDQPEPPKVTT